jgi:hypothetical protein
MSNSNTTNENEASETNDDSDPENGLYGKYEVTQNGAPVRECFVLEPESDKAARMAIRTYAASTSNDALAEELNKWMDDIEGEEQTE